MTKMTASKTAVKERSAGKAATGDMPQALPRQLSVVGLGYVGLPLACALAKHLPMLGFDVDKVRVADLNGLKDKNGEMPSEDLKNKDLRWTTDPAALRSSDFIIIAVPTPADSVDRPDLTNLLNATRMVGQNLSRGAIVVYESTVYPGVTEDICLPILEKESGLKAGKDFRVGYSPERVNPGDGAHSIVSVVKVVSAQDPETLDKIAGVYALVCKAGIHRAPNIKTAEAAKAIENVQRDLNIALMNELSIIFNRLGIDTWEVLKAAKTKWNFLPFEPGLVGGHCIPVDPFYLTHKAQEVGYHPEVILAGRRVNDGMGRHVAQEAVKCLIRSGKVVKGSKALVLGLTFKENVKDVRNSRVFDLIDELESYGVETWCHDPMVDPAKHGLKSDADPFSQGGRYDAVILAVSHRQFRARPTADFLSLLKKMGTGGVLADIKAVLKRPDVEKAGALYWTL